MRLSLLNSVDFFIFLHTTVVQVSYKTDDASSFPMFYRYKSCLLVYSIDFCPNIQVCPSPFDDMLVHTLCGVSIIDTMIY